jgi:hypothetical protein
VIVIEYERKSFQKVCKQFGAQLSVVLRDRDVSPAGESGYVYQAC